MFSILLVDDEPMMIKGMQFMLENSQWSASRIHVAPNGMAAMDILQEFGADVVVTDIRMPNMDGLELVQQLSVDHPLVPVIIVSGYDEFEYARQAMKYGVKEYLLKPLKKQPFVETIGKTIAGLERQVYPSGLTLDEWRRLADSWVDAVCDGQAEARAAVEARWLSDVQGAPPSLALSWHGIFHESLLQRAAARLEGKVESELLPYEGESRTDLRKWAQADMSRVAETITLAAGSDVERVIHAAKLWIRMNYNKENSLEELALSFGYTAPYFSLLFKQRTGISYVAYRSQVRMNRAKEMLLKTDTPITLIAYEVGYTDVAGFIRSFKKEVGTTPSLFRKEGVLP